MGRILGRWRPRSATCCAGAELPTLEIATHVVATVPTSGCWMDTRVPILSVHGSRFTRMRDKRIRLPAQRRTADGGTMLLLQSLDQLEFGVRTRATVVVLLAGGLLCACGDADNGGPTPAPFATTNMAPTVLPSDRIVPQASAPEPNASGLDRPAPPAGASAAPADADHSSVAALHAQGVYHQVGDYRLQMDSFIPDATAAVQSVNQFNRPPSEGAYAVAAWTVTYTGSDEGTPWIELATAVMGADGVQYEHNKCSAVVKNGLMTTMRVLNPGGTFSFATCYDAPPKALAGATAVRAGTLNRTDRVDWSTKR
jgi:hypothetical protein